MNSGALKFAIEQQAVNEATFRCPDELGWQPQVGVALPVVIVYCWFYLPGFRLVLILIELTLLFLIYQQFPIIDADGGISRAREVLLQSVCNIIH